MTTSEKYMLRCIELAQRGAGYVSPNPMVGCVIVHNNKIIGEGYHQEYGKEHAEVHAINSVKNTKLLKESTIYVSLEPCSHFGQTPPCADLIVKNEIPKAVIGSIDPFAKVAGRGIERLKNAGIHVQVGILAKQCTELNKRFFTFHEKKRPYIFLKWAQTKDGFIDIIRSSEKYGEPTWITGKEALINVHKLRAEEDAILVGTNTVEKDNPSLTLRHCKGQNPLRLFVDKDLRLPENLNVFDKQTPTLVINGRKDFIEDNLEFVTINFSENIVPQILDILYHRKCLSLIVEGGKQLLESFIAANLWDEAHVYTGNKNFNDGIAAPKLKGMLIASHKYGEDKQLIFKNKTQFLGKTGPSGRILN